MCLLPGQSPWDPHRSLGSNIFWTARCACGVSIQNLSLTPFCPSKILSIPLFCHCRFLSCSPLFLTWRRTKKRKRTLSFPSHQRRSRRRRPPLLPPLRRRRSWKRPLQSENSPEKEGGPLRGFRSATLLSSDSLSGTNGAPVSFLASGVETSSTAAI